MGIIFICPYPIGQSPSQRFRFEQYFDLLRSKGYCLNIHPFLSLSIWKILYTPGQSIRKIYAVLSGFAKRFMLLPTLRKYDFVFIHREATPIGPPWFEWIAAKVFKKKIIYDFDDAIWLPNTSEENSVISKLKWHRKVTQICKWSYRISCGNQYLADFAKKLNYNVILNPTTIDNNHLHNSQLYRRKLNSEQVVIGWTGTHSTLKYLNVILPALERLKKRHEFQFVVIADTKPNIALSSFKFIRWSKETEVQDLLQFDIGVMPLTEDMWANGKCGFKILQYMALGIPAIASPVGVNKIIIKDGVNGFLCNSLDAWEVCIEKLMHNADLRNQLGAKGREHVDKHYSLTSNSSNFLSLFE